MDDAGAPGMPEVPSAVRCGSIAFSCWFRLEAPRSIQLHLSYETNPFSPLDRYFLLPLSGSQAGDVIINEIMYPSRLGGPGAEYIELYNTSTNTVDLGGWRFEKGISFVFPTNTALPAGAFLVIVADTNVFAANVCGCDERCGRMDWPSPR